MLLIPVCWFVFSNLTEPSYVYKFSWIAYEDDHKISYLFTLYDSLENIL